MRVTLRVRLMVEAGAACCASQAEGYADGWEVRAACCASQAEDSTVIGNEDCVLCESGRGSSWW